MGFCKSDETNAVEHKLELTGYYQEDQAGYPFRWNRKEKLKGNHSQDKMDLMGDYVKLLGFATAAVRKHPDLLEMEERW